MRRFNLCLPSLSVCIVLLIALSSGCGDPSPVGAGVLEGERLDLRFTDTFKLSAKTILPPSVPVTFRRGTNEVASLSINNRIVGQLDDPVTGSSYAEVALRLRVSTVNPTFTGAVVDSVVLSLVYDARGSYGDQEAIHQVDINELADLFPDSDTLYADEQLARGPLLGSRSMVPRPADSILIIQHGLGTVAELRPQMRIRLDNSFGQSILDDPSIIQNDSTLEAFMPGLVISSSTSNSLFGLNLSPAINQPSTSPNGVTIYYSLDDTTRAQYRLSISSEISSYIDHDFARGSMIIDDVAADSILVSQGLNGVNAAIDLGSIASIADEVLNFAELVMYVARDEMIDPDLYPPSEILASQYNSSDSTMLASIEDFTIALNAGRVATLFGGVPTDVVVDDVAIQEIRINITTHLKTLQDDPSADRRLILVMASKLQRPGRTIVYGPGHSKYPMKLNVTFTDI